MIKKSKRIVFFGGAGTSTESGICDFRSKRGLYSTEFEKMKPEKILSVDFMLENPKMFYRFIKEKLYVNDAKPSDGHRALFKLEKKGKLKAIITQNIDNLHQMAGNKNVIELHGSMHRAYCIKCHKKYGINDIIESKNIVPICRKCGGMIRPDVILYNEPLDEKVLKESIDEIKKSDMLIVCGTSLMVYPAAGLLDYYKHDRLVYINHNKTQRGSIANLYLEKSFCEAFNTILE